jgi:hypothetical protein
MPSRSEVLGHRSIRGQKALGMPGANRVIIDTTLKIIAYAVAAPNSRLTR